jgi:hypothetical protein
MRPDRLWSVRLVSTGVAALLSSTLLVGSAFAQHRAAPSSAKLATAGRPVACPAVSPTGAAGTTVCSEKIVDGGFETGGIPNTFWNPETSTNFGTPLCDVPSCGTGGGASPPYAGAFWAWFGGIPAPEDATIGQTMTIPTGTASLTFQMRIGTVSSPFTDTLTVSMDGTPLQVFPEPSVAEGAYTLRTIDVTAYANGASHNLLFHYAGPSSGTGSFVVDNVSLQACVLTAVTVASTSALRTSRGVSVRWTTGSERGLVGFRVYRQDGPKRLQVNSKLLPAFGTFAGRQYSVIDRGAPQGRALKYWIAAVHFDGTITWHGPALVTS